MYKKIKSHYKIDCKAVYQEKVMKFFYFFVGALSLCLMGCESKDEERAELDLIVQLEEENKLELDPLSERAVTGGEQERSFLDLDEMAR